MKLFIKTLKKTLLLIISCSLLFIATSDAVATSIFIPPGTTTEAFEEVNVIDKALGFKYIGLKLITPYSEESVDLCLEALKNKFLFVKEHGLNCLIEIVEQWDVPASTLDEKIYPAVKALPEKKFELTKRRLTLWLIQFKQLPSEEEHLRFLKLVLMDRPPGESARKWGSRYKGRAVDYLTKMASDEAKSVLQETLELEQKRTGRELDKHFIEDIRVSIDELDLRQRLDSLGGPAQQVAALKSYLLKHREIAKRLREEKIKEFEKEGNKGIAISIRAIYHHVTWSIHQLGMMNEPLPLIP
jgi:hypothetical protein